MVTHGKLMNNLEGLSMVYCMHEGGMRKGESGDSPGAFHMLQIQGGKMTTEDSAYLRSARSLSLCGMHQVIARKLGQAHSQDGHSCIQHGMSHLLLGPDLRIRPTPSIAPAWE